MKVGRINRGDIWIVNLEPAFGRELHKKRPGVIISKNSINHNTPHVIVVPSSSIIPQNLSSDMISVKGVAGFDKESVLLPILIRSIDQIRLVKKVGKLPKEKMLEIEEVVKLVMELDKSADF